MKHPYWLLGLSRLYLLKENVDVGRCCYITVRLQNLLERRADGCNFETGDHCSHPPEQSDKDKTRGRESETKKTVRPI